MVLPGNECKMKMGHLQPLAKLVSWQEMSDVFTKAKRSAVMSLIRGRGNKDTELRLIAIFREHRISGWRRLHRLHGRPDFVFPREKLVVFVDGCFWHGCPKHATWPKQNAEFWRIKILGNRRRDRGVNRQLRKTGWRVVRIWEHA
jgi:DNA mismatch endonuclease (patch repair protein)